MTASGGSDEDLFLQLHELVTARLQGHETPEQAAALGRLLESSAEARRIYLTYIGDSVTLHLLGNGKERARDRETRSMTSSWRLRTFRLGWALAGALALVVVLGARLLRTGEHAPTYRGVAVLAHAVGAEWQPAAAAPQPGAVLKAGPLRLLRGLAQLEFFSGATVVVEGPAELDLVSGKEVSLRRGKARATVPPPARGFLINAPGMGVVDLGTEFGLAVDETGSRVHVFEGELELRPAAGSGRLTKGQSASVDPAGARRLSTSVPGDSFVDRASLAGRADDDLTRRHRRWTEHSLALRRDPSVVLYFTFEDQAPWDRMITSQVSYRGAAVKGAVVGARFSAGRWPGKSALELKRPGDRARLELPGEFESMTMAAWVRFDGFDRELMSLFLTDGFDRGEPHWQVSRKGELILGVGGPGNHYSPVVISTLDLGRWVHLAVVYDHATLRVTHYMDGRPVGGKRIDRYVPLVVGAAEIGNWGLPLGNTDQPVRNLNGAVDELVMFARAVSAEEIAAMYEAGRPQ